MEKPKDNAETKRELALLSWVQQFAPYGIFTLDTSMRVQSWNRWMEAHSSLPLKEIAGRNLFEIFPELEERKLRATFERALAGESSMLSTSLHRYLLPLKSPPDGPMRQTARVGPLLFDEIICGVIVVIEDVTQRESQAESLEGQHRRDETLSWALVHLLKSAEPRKTARQLFFKIAEHLDFDTFFLYLRDPQSGETTLYTAGGISEELQKDFLKYELLANTAGAEEPIVFNAVKNRQGPEFSLLKEAKVSSAIAIPLRSNDKALGSLCFASWSRDQIAPEESELLITVAQYLATAVDKENTNDELRVIGEANRWMGAIVESSDDAIISKNLDGIIKSFNKGAARLFGYEPGELIGKPIALLIPQDRQPEGAEILAKIRRGEHIEHFETVHQRKDGSLIEVSLTISPVKDVHGQIIGGSQIARDITERKKSVLKLAESLQREKAARELAEQANLAKDNFLASLSHELRTPLNPVLLIASDSAENPDLPAPVRRDFETIRNNIELEARLIDDLLDLTRIAHGKLSLYFQTIDPQAVLLEAIANIQSDLNAKQIQMVLNWNVLQPAIHGDAVRLLQIFWNVLKNAVKFTPHNGKIIIGTDVANGQLTISVTDTGIGMSPDELERIFEAFSQGDHVEKQSHRFGGLGLGLAIARRLVEMHSGRIQALSAGLGEGSTFIIVLPLAKVETSNALLPEFSTTNATTFKPNP